METTLLAMASHLLAQPDAERPPEPRAIEARSHLPVPLTPFVGRALEVSTALALLFRNDVRLVSLTGPGGAGKTRMAIEIARRAPPEFPDGVRFIELASLTDPNRLIPSIAREFQIPESSDKSPLDLLEHLLESRRMLLVLDNFDQIVDTAPSVVDLLLRCPLSKVLVTSRIVLNVQGEHELPVPPMSLPASGPGQTWRVPDIDSLHEFDAIELFAQRARAARPDFEISDSNSLAVINVCRRLDGLPLAIELAAARTKILSPEALLSRLTRSLDVLSDGARDLPPRLQTMRAAIAWSYELLETQDQVLLQRLSTFAGGFTFDAAEAVCGSDHDVLSGIATLANNSLLRRIEQSDGTPRFLMLGTVREFGIEQLHQGTDEQDARERHARWFAAWIHESETRLFGPDLPDLLDQFEIEYDNIRAALRWLGESEQIEDALNLANDCAFFWFYRGHFLEAIEIVADLRQRAVSTPTPGLARALCIEGLLNQALSNFPRSLELTGRSLAMAHEVGDPLTAAIAEYHLGDVLDTVGEYDEAVPHLMTALEMFRVRGEPRWISMTLAMVSLLVHRQGDIERAVEMVEEGLALARQHRFGWAEAICLNRLGRFASDAGDVERAAPLYQESLRLWNGFGDRWRVTRTLADIADCAAMLGWPDRSALLMGAAEALNEPLATSLRFADDSSWQRAYTESRGALDIETFERIWDEGRQLRWDEAVASALQPLAANAATRTVQAADNPLSRRESEVLRLLAEGRTDKEIAVVLFISPRTAQGHVSNIFNKLAVNSRAAAVATALQRGLIPLNDPLA